MTGYETYCLFSSLKQHFNSKYYDYFKYNGRLKASAENYDKRNDKHIFQSLGKKRNTYNLVLSNLLNDASIWVTGCLTEEAKKICREWERIQQSLQYIYQKDLVALDSDFNKNFIAESGSDYPKIITLMNHKIITMETVIIIDQISNFLIHADKKIEDRIIWPNIYTKIKKYSPFISIDKQIYKDVTVDTFS
ncbi:MAG: hypothetical protein NTZ20_04710 [Candidatus Levybacteria bacterium]|nr:hypothetical protein [Candidatus Levybacteria bacterium]